MRAAASKPLRKALPRGVGLRAGRFTATLTWEGRNEALGLFDTLSEAVEARYRAEVRKGWPGASSDRGKTLAERQAEALRKFAENDGEALRQQGEQRHKLAVRTTWRRRNGWCAVCASEVEAGGFKLCAPQSFASGSPERRAFRKARRAPERHATGPAGVQAGEVSEASDLSLCAIAWRLHGRVASEGKA